MSHVLRDVEKASVALLDRWRIQFNPADRRPPLHRLSGPHAPNPSRIMNNYLGVGVDAKVAHPHIKHPASHIPHNKHTQHPIDKT
jgi:hypothetical protein